MDVLFVHLLNNYTGSPNVLSNFLMDYCKSHKNICLLTSKTEGCLSNLPNIQYVDNKYRWISNRIFLTFRFIFSQIYQFLYVLFNKRYDCVYINTILPFGAAFAAKIRKEKVVYHVHEYYPKPHFMQRICVYFASKCADEYIFVSNYLKSCYKGIFLKKGIVIHNAVSNELKTRAKDFITNNDYIKNKFINKQIVLPCALKKYKGVNVFLELSKQLPQYNFLLVTSNSKNESDSYFKDKEVPKNFKILNQVKDMSKIYSDASIVLNLSIPHGIDKIIETFSMILIEAFEYKTPCIAPCYGGPLEIIQEGENGYLLEVENITEVINKIEYIMSDYNLYKVFSEKAYTRSKDFSTAKFVYSIKKIITEGKND